MRNECTSTKIECGWNWMRRKRLSYMPKYITPRSLCESWLNYYYNWTSRQLYLQHILGIVLPILRPQRYRKTSYPVHDNSPSVAPHGSFYIARTCNKLIFLMLIQTKLNSACSWRCNIVLFTALAARNKFFVFQFRWFSPIGRQKWINCLNAVQYVPVLVL